MTKWLFILILLAGAGLRFHQAAADFRFHPDEAYYASFARDAVTYGDWMLPGALDKPPLSIYLDALAMNFFAARVDDNALIQVGIRQGEFAARLANAFAGVLLMALIYVAAGRSLVALLLAAASPYLLVFSASAFTDTLMLLCMFAALVLARYPRWSGLLLALSIAAKPQGVFYLPLVLVYVCGRWRFMMAFLLGIGALLLWDAARPETSVFALGTNNYDWVFAGDVMGRLRTWLGYAGWMLGPPWLTALILVMAIRRVRLSPVVMFCGGYFLLHWLVAFNTFDRYLLPIVPLVIVMVGNVHIPRIHKGDLSGRPYADIVITGLAGVALILAAFSTPPIGRDHYPAHKQVIPLAQYLNAKPLGTIIYDRWSGWELNYYMGAWSDKRRVYYPSPERLAEDAFRNPEQAPRYFVAPRSVNFEPWLLTLKDRVCSVTSDYENPDYIVYELIFFCPSARLPVPS